ncbi:conserved hypothetical protein [Leishmania major strain Friedlin]|uniref:Uncharacterized protein n=1 Tax=Leishmania major TaxID=5664 RepID=Q4Q0U4_LEIMA|nr:conserved hypothetical protein [Leishmania major strain Friedlin]CAG9584018.1 Alpha/beta_hydrolase_family_-_putative [Leishmania major strain Friedlin]CAJ09440.1 conserved hypothetical protein [Leishmania major strain Friedlin]|eukprot:XP_001687054.1 conserved hypothetical protein [Leishmania major strain Friedlin]
MNIHISGNLSKPTVIFIAGWPDTCDVFRDNVMATLAADYRIVGVTLPGFDDEHPFLNELRKRGDAAETNQLGKLRRGGGGVSTACAATGSTWMSALPPMRFLTSAGAVLQPTDSSSSSSGGTCARTPLQAFGVPCRCAALEPFRTSWKGHSFQDLVTLLEIAVDTAMETCNYCPPVRLPISAEAQASARRSGGGETETSQPTTDAFAAHQLPPTYTRPVLIAHGWGCLLAYELLLARPSLFSRIVALDVGAYCFESDAAHVERMCALVSGQGKGKPTDMTRSPFAAAEAQVALNKEKAANLSASGREVDTIAQTTATCDPDVGQQGRIVPAAGAAPTLTLLRGQSTSPLDAVPALSTLPPMRSGPSTSGTKRSLASQYAIRRRRGAALPQRAEARKRLFIILYQFFLIVCELFVPHRLARWLVEWFASVSGRPYYSYDPQMVVTPTMELLNHTLNAQFFARHPLAVENRGALQLPMLLQTEKTKASPSSSAAAAAATVEAGYCKSKGPAQPTTAGWKIMLIPYLEKMPVTAFRGSATSGNQGRLQSNGRPLSERGVGEAFEGNCGTIRKSTHSGRAQRQWLYGDSSTDSCTGADGMGDTSEGDGGAGESGTTFDKKNPTDGAHVVFSSYAKGADMVFDEWNSLAADTRGIVDGGPSGLGSSGELDPYTSVNGIAAPAWVTEDPLTLTGAQSFMETNRATGVDSKDISFLMAADGICSSDGGRADTFGVSSSTGARQMHVAKRRLFYQAVVFPPLSNDTIASSSTPFHGNLDGGDSDRSSVGPRSTVLSRLRKSNRSSPLRPAVPVLASPSHSWIYLRFWLGTLVLRLVALVSWLLGEKPATPSSSVPGEGAAALSATVAPSRASSNVMTTAMTTIYRRLPATPSLAADVSTLPGNGDVLLQPKSHAPLVTQRYFVPLAIPILFMYGGEKRVMFHADHWCSYIRQHQRRRDGISDVVEVQGGGHWFFAEKKYQKKVADRIAEFLAAEPTTPYEV